LPKKAGKGDEHSGKSGQEGSGRSPLRTTSFCGIMEMIKEEEAQWVWSLSRLENSMQQEKQLKLNWSKRAWYWLSF